MMLASSEWWGTARELAAMPVSGIVHSESMAAACRPAVAKCLQRPVSINEMDMYLSMVARDGDRRHAPLAPPEHDTTPIIFTPNDADVPLVPLARCLEDMVVRGRVQILTYARPDDVRQVYASPGTGPFSLRLLVDPAVASAPLPNWKNNECALHAVQMLMLMLHARAPDLLEDTDDTGADALFTHELAACAARMLALWSGRGAPHDTLNIIRDIATAYAWPIVERDKHVRRGTFVDTCEMVNALVHTINRSDPRETSVSFSTTRYTSRNPDGTAVVKCFERTYPATACPRVVLDTFSDQPAQIATVFAQAALPYTVTDEYDDEFEFVGCIAKSAVHTVTYAVVVPHTVAVHDGFLVGGLHAFDTAAARTRLVVPWATLEEYRRTNSIAALVSAGMLPPVTVWYVRKDLVVV